MASAAGAVSLESRAHFRALSRRWRASTSSRARWAMWCPGNGANRWSIENRPGAGGVIASQALVTSPPDGYTLIVVASGHATNPFLYAKLPYDTFNDFTPISLLASSPNILLVRADSPFKTVADMIAQARAKPGSLSFGNAGTGTSTHLAGELSEESRQDRHQSDFLQRRCARDQRSAGRSDPDVVQQRPGIGRAIAGRHAARASRDHRVAGLVSAGGAEHGRDRSGLRHRCVVGPAGAGRHAAGVDCKAVARLRRRAQHRLGESAAHQARGDANRQYAGAIRRQDPRRLCEMGADHQGRRHSPE